MVRNPLNIPNYGVDSGSGTFDNPIDIVNTNDGGADTPQVMQTTAANQPTPAPAQYQTTGARAKQQIITGATTEKEPETGFDISPGWLLVGAAVLGLVLLSGD
jgi:hypothetical protein